MVEPMTEQQVTRWLCGGVVLVAALAFTACMGGLILTEGLGLSIRIWWWTAFGSALSVCASLSAAIAIRQVRRVRRLADIKKEKISFRYMLSVSIFFLITGAFLLGLLESFSVPPPTRSSASFYGLSGGVVGLGLGALLILMLAESENGVEAYNLADDQYETIHYS
jgi:hypothetical protein